MRGRRPAALAVVAALATAGCAAPPDGPVAAPEPPPDAALVAVPSAATGADVDLCQVLPARLVGELVGASRAVEASGAGPQCTWRAAPGRSTQGPGRAPAEADGPALQGALLDRPAYDAGRPAPGDPAVAAVSDLADVGDEAFVVHLASGLPTTLYARAGDRVVSLWLDGAALGREAAERSLARTATLLLRLA